MQSLEFQKDWQSSQARLSVSPVTDLLIVIRAKQPERECADICAICLTSPHSGWQPF
jgi:hypothetical protein